MTTQEEEEEMIHEVAATGNAPSVASTTLPRGPSASGAASLVAMAEVEWTSEVAAVAEMTSEDEEVAAVGVVVTEVGVEDEVEAVEVSHRIVVQGQRIGIVQDAGCPTLATGPSVSDAALARTKSLQRKAQAR